MICPNCRSEIGSQPVCPYCGNNMQQRSASAPPFAGQAPNPLPRTPEPYANAGKQGVNAALRRLSRQLSVVDLRSKLTLVLAVGIFLMQLIILIVLAGN